MSSIISYLTTMYTTIKKAETAQQRLSLRHCYNGTRTADKILSITSLTTFTHRTMCYQVVELFLQKLYTKITPLCQSYKLHFYTFTSFAPCPPTQLCWSASHIPTSFIQSLFKQQTSSQSQKWKMCLPSSKILKSPLGSWKTYTF